MYCLGMKVMMEWSGDGAITMDDVGQEYRRIGETHKKKMKINNERGTKAGLGK
jgi:hypothetical protein